MTYSREEVINYAPGGDSVKTGIEKLDTDLTGAFTHLNTIDTDLTNHAADTSTHGVTTVAGISEIQTLTNKTLESVTLANGYTEGVYSLTGTDISPSNGSIQHKILSGNTTFTESLSDGQSVTLMLNPSTFAATWPTTTWIGSTASTAPALVASVYNCITFFQIAGTLYGKYEGRV